MDSFSNYDSMFSICVSTSSFKSDLKSSLLVREESKQNFNDHIWSSFLCILSLSSVIQRSIISVFPDFGPLKYRTLFNAQIFPRTGDFGNSPFRILFCNLTRVPLGKDFFANHYVPLTNRKKMKKVDKCKLRETKSLSCQPPQKISRLSLPKLIGKQTKLKAVGGMLSNPTIYNFFNTKDSTLNKSSSTLSVSSLSTSLVLSSSPPLLVSSSTLISSSNLVPSSLPVSSSTLPHASSLPLLSHEVSPQAPISISTTSVSTSSSSVTTELNKQPITLPKTNFRMSSPISSFFSTTENQNTNTILERKSCNALKYDVGTYYAKVKSLSPTGVNDLIDHVFCPDQDYDFPKHENGRKFRYSWLLSFPWLRYSPSLKGGFCLHCCLFSHGMPSKSKGLMISRPAFPTASVVATFREHADVKHGIHAFATDALNSFLKTFKGSSMSIDVLIESTKVAKEKEFRQILVPLVDTVIFLGRRGLPFRGHRDGSGNLPPAGEYSTAPGVGNFIELLNYGIRRGDSVLKDHYTNHSKNASYFSQQTQNELIDCCGELITERIIKRVTEAKFFSILADEAMDAAKMEQLALVLRYVHQDVIYEDFIGFLHLKDGLTGGNLANAILSFLEKLGLDFQNIRRQGYDGAGSVAGHKSGCSA